MLASFRNSCFVIAIGETRPIAIRRRSLYDNRKETQAKPEIENESLNKAEGPLVNSRDRKVVECDETKVISGPKGRHCFQSREVN